MAAICATDGLGKKGYLKGHEAICFPGFEKDLHGATIRIARGHFQVNSSHQRTRHCFGFRINNCICFEE